MTKLLATSGKCNVSKPGIEVISEETSCDGNDEGDDLEWEWNQEFYDEEVLQYMSCYLSTIIASNLKCR